MSRTSAAFRSDDRGQAIVLIAFALAALLLGVGLAIDTGTLFVARRHAQAAADSAAWAGAVVLYRGGTAIAAAGAAQADSTENGYTNGASSTTVSAVTPPTGGEWVGDARFIEVSITRRVRTIFLPGTGGDGLTPVTARAIAGAAPTGKGLAILTLGGGVALEAVGGSTLTVSGSGIHVNSTDSPAAKTTGTGSSITGDPIEGLKVRGTTSGSGFTPAPTTTTEEVFDPFLAMPEPPDPGTTQGTNTNVNSDQTLSPGVYVGGIKVTASGVLTLQPGVYILKGGGLDVAGTGEVKLPTGATDGVMIFNTVDDYPGSAGACGDITIAGSSKLTLSAPTSGTYKGMLLWQDKDCSPLKNVSLTGSSAAKALSGTFYVPNAAVKISGTSDALLNIDSQIISSKVELNGGVNVTLNYNANKWAKPLAPSLVE